MEKAITSVQNAKDFIWNHYCDRVEDRALSQQKNRSMSEPDAGCFLCPKESYLYQIESPKTLTPCCAERVDTHCLENWMRSCNARRIGIEAGDRFKPVKCPSCRAPFDELTVQDLVVKKTVKTLRDLGEGLTEIFRLNFNAARTHIQTPDTPASGAEGAQVSALPDATSTPLDVEGSEGLSQVNSQDTSQDDMRQIANTIDRKIKKTLPAQLTAITLAQPKHPQLQDARQTTLAVMLLQQIGQIACDIAEKGGTTDFTSLPLALSFYSVLGAYLDKLQAAGLQKAFSLERCEQTARPADAIQADVAAEYVDDAYRATVMMGSQLVDEVKQHVDQAKWYNEAIQSARIGIEMPDELSTSERSTVENQWIGFTQASGVQQINSALKNNGQALVTIVNALLKTDVFTCPAQVQLPHDVKGTIDDLNSVLDKIDDFVQRLKRKAEGAADQGEAIHEIVESLYGELRGSAESLARQVLAVVDGTGPHAERVDKTGSEATLGEGVDLPPAACSAASNGVKAHSANCGKAAMELAAAGGSEAAPSQALSARRLLSGDDAA
jgi:hypothetical protein